MVFFFFALLIDIIVNGLVSGFCFAFTILLGAKKDKKVFMLVFLLGS